MKSWWTVLAGVVVVVASVASTVRAEVKAQPQVAVTDLKPVGIEPGMARAVTVVLAAEVQARLGRGVISTTDIDTLLGIEKTKDLLGCDNVSCFSEFAGALNVPTLIVGSLAKVGDTVVIDLRLIDARGLTVESRVYEKLKRPDDAVLLMPILVSDLFKKRVQPSSAQKPVVAAKDATAALPEDEFGTGAARMQRILEYLGRFRWSHDRVRALTQLRSTRSISDPEYDVARQAILADLVDPSRGRAPIVPARVQGAPPVPTEPIAGVEPVVAAAPALPSATRVQAILSLLTGKSMRDQGLELGTMRRSGKITEDEYLAVRDTLLFGAAK